MTHQGDGAGQLVEQEVRFYLVIFPLRGGVVSYSLFNFSTIYELDEMQVYNCSVSVMAAFSLIQFLIS